jgi:hypothetical protein
MENSVGRSTVTREICPEQTVLEDGLCLHLKGLE